LTINGERDDVEDGEERRVEDPAKPDDEDLWKKAKVWISSRSQAFLAAMHGDV